MPTEVLKCILFFVLLNQFSDSLYSHFNGAFGVVNLLVGKAFFGTFLIGYY